MYQESAERVGEENGKGEGDASECHSELARREPGETPNLSNKQRVSGQWQSQRP